MELFASELGAGISGHDAAYALLRYALRLSRGMDCPEICRVPGGKPGFVGRDDLFFSLSHTKTHVLVALSDHEVGADIETLRHVTDRLRSRLFTAAEQDAFDFFEGWTLREAVFKLTGAGSLTGMPLSRENGSITVPIPGVRCRNYDDIPGCACAVACREGAFPTHIEIVPPDAIWT